MCIQLPLHWGPSKPDRQAFEIDLASACLLSLPFSHAGAQFETLQHFEREKHALTREITQLEEELKNHDAKEVASHRKVSQSGEWGGNQISLSCEFGEE